MDFTGRPIAGVVYVGPRGVKTAASVAKWVREAADHALTLPAARRTAAPTDHCAMLNRAGGD